MMTVKRLVRAATLVGVAAVLFVPETAADDAEQCPLANYVLYGVSGSTDELLRYRFDERQSTSTSSIQLSSGDTLSGIEALVV